jgi:hypothetical protein
MTTNLEDATARIKAFDQRLSEAIAKFKASTGVETMTTTKTNDDATADIAAPILCADAIVERFNEDTKETVYEVEKAGKVIYSTLSRPLAFAFIAGVNTNQTDKSATSKSGDGSVSAKGAKSGGDDGDSQSGEGVNRRNTPGSKSGGSGEPSKPTPASLDSAKPERSPVEAGPRKRVAL